MAEIADGGGGGNSGGKKRAKKSSTRVDMTPMVDLAFLLLTFFVLTSTFAEPKIMSLVYPAKIDEKNPDVKPPKVNNGITFILTEDKVFYYSGQYRKVAGEGFPATTLEEANFGPGEGSIRKLLADRNKVVILRHKELDLKLQRREMVDSIAKKELIKAKKLPAALKVLIKTDLKATCKNFIDLVDELKIADVGVIAPVDLTKDEEDLLNAKLR
jgi:biopolymer transport protein ExbD